ncbi:uncharacterized protein LOC133782773 [Humulus lupulus]|uniref:uncharacterized protein LOC133782773 n=1 Tax=Humulus lupulus TaxID=3486 RepID=UPI002B400565|nr:uncharacterized protein LOC133782773 [Humulus lupulus]
MCNLQLKRYATIANPDVLFISQALRHQATAVDLLSHRSADLVAELAMKMETIQLELEAAVNQREANKEALAKETAQAQVDHAEFDRVKAGLEEALSRKETEANERVALLEAAAAQSARDREEIQNLTDRVRELESSLREEKTVRKGGGGQHARSHFRGGHLHGLAQGQNHEPLGLPRPGIAEA